VRRPSGHGTKRGSDTGPAPGRVWQVCRACRVRKPHRSRPRPRSGSGSGSGRARSQSRWRSSHSDLRHAAPDWVARGFRPVDMNRRQGQHGNKVAGPAATPLSVAQVNRGGPRGCALSHAASVRGSVRTTDWNPSVWLGLTVVRSSDGGSASTGAWIVQYGQCSSRCAGPDPAGDGSASDSSHVEPFVEHTATHDAALPAARACDSDGTSEASRIASTAIQAAGWRWARSRRMAPDCRARPASTARHGACEKRAAPSLWRSRRPRTSAPRMTGDAAASVLSTAVRTPDGHGYAPLEKFR
jgi:hypothetical protein